MTDKELSNSGEERRVSLHQQNYLTAEELAGQILSTYKESVKRAGQYSPDEYKMFYGSTQAKLEMWLTDLLARVNWRE